MTRGELGGDWRVRRKEFLSAMTYWGIAYELFDFPDMGLTYTNTMTMVKRLAGVVVKDSLNVLIGFHPHRFDYGFDHPDHGRSGEVVRLASVMARKEWTKLYFWEPGGRSVLAGKRQEYLRRFYPLQKVDSRILKQTGESYLKIR